MSIQYERNIYVLMIKQLIFLKVLIINYLLDSALFYCYLLNSSK